MSEPQSPDSPDIPQTPTPDVPDVPEPDGAGHDAEIVGAAPSSWATLRAGMAIRSTKGQVLVGILCAALGFALVVQIKQNQSTDLSGLSQQELVRILDEVTRRTDDLEKQSVELRSQRADLVTGTDTQRAAQLAAASRAESQGILAGRLPAEGPGVAVTLREGQTRLTAAMLVDVLESLRNAGAEAIDLGGRRVTASTYIIDTVQGVKVDGVNLTAPYRWLAIGDPDTLRTALEMPGGSMAAIRNVGASTDVTALDVVEIDSVRSLITPRFATPVPSPTQG